MFALLFASLAFAGERIETIDARSIDAKVLSLAGNKLELLVGSEKRTLPLGDVAEITFAPSQDAMGKPAQAVLTTAAGDVLPVTALTVADGKIAFYCSLLGRAEMKLKHARTIYMPAPNETASFVTQRCGELKLPEPTTDALVIDRGNRRWTAAGGVLVAVDAKKVTFRWKDDQRTIDRAAVRAIRLASMVSAPRRIMGMLVGRKGAVVAIESVKIDGDTVVVRTVFFGERKIPRDRVGAIRLRSDRVVRLTDLKPVAVKEVPFFDMKFPYRTGLSVGGKPLRLGGRAYGDGLGLHSFCELTYQIDGKFKKFVATVGIDDAVRPAGDAVLTFFGDDKPLHKPLHLTGKTDPAGVRFDVTGVKRFTIRVDYGPDKIDAADHVDLAAPRFIK